MTITKSAYHRSLKRTWILLSCSCNFQPHFFLHPPSPSLTTGIALAQDGAKQDMKAAGADTKNAARDTGHAALPEQRRPTTETAGGTKTAAHKTADGTEKAYHKTENGTRTATDTTVNGTKTVGKDVGHGTKVAAKDAAHGTEKVGDKIAGKPDPH
jgi:hypothetical protein